MSSTSLAQTSYIDSVQRVVDQHKRDTIEIEALLNLTHEYSRKDFDKSKSYVYQAITLSNTLGNITKLSGCYQYLVFLHQGAAALDSASYYLSLLESMSKKYPSNKKITSGYKTTAGLFYKNLGQYKKALPFMLSNIQTLHEENENKAGQLLNLGNVYHYLGDYKNAAQYHLQSLRIFEKVNSKRGVSFTLQSLANDFLELGQFEKARTYTLRALKIKTELEDKRGIITSWTTLGDIAKDTKQYPTAKEYYQKAIQSSREMKFISEEARSINQLGLLYKRMGDLKSAHENFVNGLKLARLSGDSSLSASIRSELIELNTRKIKDQETEAALISNLSTFSNLGDKRNEALSYSRLSEYYAANNQYDKAFSNLKKQMELSNNLTGGDVILQIKQLEEQFQSEKKEKEIELLKKDQELKALALTRERSNVIMIAIALASVLVISVLLINRYRVMNRNKRMAEMESMRYTIARDLHDDIGSTLSSINIISQIALEQNGTAGKQHLQKIASHSARMMENMSDIVWSINPKNDSLEQLVTKMKEFASEILEPKEIDYKFYVDSILMKSIIAVDKRKNIFLIFKEAINNTAKYSEGNLVIVSFFERNETLHLTVGDNGIGFDSVNEKKGNGLLNMEYRAKAMNARLRSISKPGEGTQIDLEVPIT